MATISKPKCTKNGTLGVLVLRYKPATEMLAASDLAAAAWFNIEAKKALGALCKYRYPIIQQVSHSLKVPLISLT